MVHGCAQLIAALVLLLIGLGLFVVAPIIGIAYFGLLIVIALVRVLLR